MPNLQQETFYIQHFGEDANRKYDYYLKKMNGYTAAKKAAAMGPEKIIEEVKIANLRGRGGAGFPAGVKWSFLPKNSDKNKYLVCNADESEPGTFKDRDIMRYSPHLLIEGMLIASYALGVHRAYIYIRGEYVREAEIFNKAIEEAKTHGVLGKSHLIPNYELEIVVHRGAGAYICGEETALLNSIEGKRGEPRVKPPFPAVSGLFGCPTIINNVETLAAVPHIINLGGGYFSKIGKNEKSGGTRLIGVSGHVKKPGLYELPSGGVTIRELIYNHCGGILNDEKLKAVIPGGSSAPVLTSEEIDVIYDVDTVAKAGSMMGSAGVIVISETECMVNFLLRIMHFYAHESCGQCTPCREGSAWIVKILHRIEHGHGQEQDVDLLISLADQVAGKSLCALGDAFAGPVASFVKKFRQEFEAHIRGGRCPSA